jgi:hypothetical protein
MDIRFHGHFLALRRGTPAGAAILAVVGVKPQAKLVPADPVARISVLGGRNQAATQTESMG